MGSLRSENHRPLNQAIMKKSQSIFSYFPQKIIAKQNARVAKIITLELRD